MSIDAISENTVEELLEFVEEDNKMRYSVIQENGRLLIRANQGHTIPCVRDEMLMTPITDPTEVNNHSATSLCEIECVFDLYLLFGSNRPGTEFGGVGPCMLARHVRRGLGVDQGQRTRQNGTKCDQYGSWTARQSRSQVGHSD